MDQCRVHKELKTLRCALYAAPKLCLLGSLTGTFLSLTRTQSSSVPALSGKLLFSSFYSMLCLLVLFCCFARNCVCFMLNSSPQASATLIGISLEISPGSLLLKGITILFFSLVACNRRCSLQKSQPFSSQVFSCSAAITYCQPLLSKF